jgi:hypothetical protein
VAGAGGSGDPALAGTDYLAVKAVNVAVNSASGKWTFLSSGATVTTTSWTPASENLSENDRVIVLSPGTLTSSAARNLVAPLTTLLSGVTSYADTSSNSETRIVYGIDSNAALATLRMPFNRADYYVKRPASGMSLRCAAGTGNLYKALVNQGDGQMSDMPLLDCVADMQVVFRLDRDNDGNLAYTNVLTDPLGVALTAEQVRNQLKEVRLYVLAQEGQKDLTYTYAFPAIPPCPANQLYVGGDSTVGNSLGRCFTFSGITDWQNYRWKLYTLVVNLDNLM